MKRLVSHDSKMKRQKKAKFLAKKADKSKRTRSLDKAQLKRWKRQKKAKFLAKTASAKAKVAEAKVKLAESKATKAQAEAVRAKERSFRMVFSDPIDYARHQDDITKKSFDTKSYLKYKKLEKAKKLLLRDRRRVVEQTQKQHRILEGHRARSKLNFKTVDTGIFFQTAEYVGTAAKTKPYVFGKGVKGKHSKPMSLQLRDTVKFLPVTRTKSGIKKRFGDLKRTASERRLVGNTALTSFEGTKSGFFIALGTRRKAWGVVRDDGKTTLLRMQSQPNKSIKRTEIQWKRPTNDQLLYLGLGGGGAAVLATRDWSTLVPYIDDVEAPKRKVGRR
ncbi:uncharacterized protein METZ01_LOCUS45425 [marine metagenome]|uniref:Uncharacterized protein n=1 Tax=marine metagenome TaxID=408172 RepID=A0A381RMX0_9ZZZZ